MNIGELISSTKEFLVKIQDESMKAIDSFSSASDELISIAKTKIEGDSLSEEKEKYWTEIIEKQISVRRDIVITTIVGGLSMVTIIALAATGNIDLLIEKGMLLAQKSSPRKA